MKKEGTERSHEKTDLQIENLFKDFTQPEPQEYVSPEVAMKLKRRRKRRRGLSP